MRARRAAQSPDEQVRAAVRLAAHVSRTRHYHASRKIACYLPINGEIDPRVLNSKEELLSGELSAEINDLLEQRGVLVFKQLHLT